MTAAPEATRDVVDPSGPNQQVDPPQERASAVVELTDVEIWEATTPSTVWVWVEDRTLGTGAWKQERVGGSGRKRIHLTVRERRYNQDQIPEENLEHDPFSNGLLICVQGAARAKNHLTDEHIEQLLAVDSDEAFEQAINSISSEVLLRRILSVARTRANNARFEFVREVVDVRYRVGGTQRTIREMMEAEARVTGSSLS